MDTQNNPDLLELLDYDTDVVDDDSAGAFSLLPSGLLTGPVAIGALIVVVVALIFLIGSSVPSVGKLRLSVCFETAHGLKDGDPVIVRGDVAGTVTNTEFGDDGLFYADIAIDADASQFVREHSVFYIRTNNLVTQQRALAIQTYDVSQAEFRSNCTRRRLNVRKSQE